MSLATVISLFAAIGTFCLVYFSSRQLKAQLKTASEEREHSRHLLEIDLILKFEERFKSERMRALRKTAAQDRVRVLAKCAHGQRPAVG